MVRCDLHDYLEIICMFHYDVAVHTDAGARVVAQAVDVVLDDNRKEVLLLKAKNIEVQAVATTSIKLIEVLTPDARFSRVVF